MDLLFYLRSLVGSWYPTMALFAAYCATLITALATSSSAATLPLSMATAEQELKVSRARSAFVLPLARLRIWTAPLLFEGIAAVFWLICLA